VLRQFLDLCQASAGKQIVMTTHSPVLLNYVHPASVRLMSMSTGRSRIQRLVDMSSKLRTSVMNGELSTFDLYDSGVLPESVPSGFSQEVTRGDEK
jgi:predicted ATP-binding protein involved in virulence